MTRIYRLFLVLLVALGAPNPASAQSLAIVDAETVAIAFYKFAGLRPNFDSWAKDSEAYRNTPPPLRPAIQREEAERLQTAYEAFSKAGNLLNVSTMAQVTLTEGADPLNKNRKVYGLSWAYAKGDADFFPYVYRRDNFALVPLQLARFRQAEITADQYRFIKERMGTSPYATLILQLRGEYADAEAPVHMRGQDFWALTTRIAGVSLWVRDGTMLWENSASWYVSPRTESLNELHRDNQDAPDTPPAIDIPPIEIGDGIE